MKMLMPFVTLAFGFIVPGCGDGDYKKPTASVSGTVTCKGQPVSFGVVTFAPVATGKDSGKSASGSIGQDGVYKMSTYGIFDGALTGRHKVSVASDDPQKKLPGVLPKDYEVEVKPGKNEIPIELK